MNKQTKMLLGIGAVALAGYLIWKSQNPKKVGLVRGASTPIFADESSTGLAGLTEVPNCVKGYKDKLGDWYVCCNPNFKSKNATQVQC